MTKGIFVEMEQTPGLEAVFQKLDFCYEQLLQAVSDTGSKPEQILELADETTALIAGLAEVLNKTDGKNGLDQLEKMSQKLQQVIEVFTVEKNKIYQAMLELKNGKQAIKSYRPPAVGMGYTEGKFVDQKK